MNIVCAHFSNMAHCIRASYVHKNLLRLYDVVSAVAASAAFALFSVSLFDYFYRDQDLHMTNLDFRSCI